MAAGGNVSEIGADTAWWYDQMCNEGGNRRYFGYVERIGGSDGDVVREGIAVAVRDLLDWACQCLKKSEACSEVDPCDDGGAGGRSW